MISHFVILGIFLSPAKSMEWHIRFGFLNQVYLVFHLSQLKLAKGQIQQVNVTIPDLDLNWQILLSILDHCLCQLARKLTPSNPCALINVASVYGHLGG
jgi:hypothetical protein